MMHLPSESDMVKAIEYDWHNSLSGTLTLVLYFIILLLEKAVNHLVSINHVTLV